MTTQEAVCEFWLQINTGTYAKPNTNPNTNSNTDNIEILYLNSDTASHLNQNQSYEAINFFNCVNRTINFFSSALPVFAVLTHILFVAFFILFVLHLPVDVVGPLLLNVSVEFYLYPTVGTVLIHSVKPELTEQDVIEYGGRSN